MELDDSARRGTAGSSAIVTDAKDSIDAYADAIAATAAAQSIGVPRRVVIAGSDAVPATLRSAMSGLRSLHCTAAASVCGALARIAQSAHAPTLFYLSYLTAASEVSSRADLAARSIWPGSIRAFADERGPASTAAASAYDAMTLLAAAAQRSGPGDRQAMRDALERITMSLIATTYSFGPSRHAGADLNDLAELRWAGTRVVLAASPPP
jgi:hypothetical protein